MSVLEIGERLLLAVFMSGAIGYDREFKSRPAGMRTHILVCVGATVIALLQAEISIETMNQISEYPELAATLKIDQTRLIAQVVSGIGFLGAGTIIVTKRAVAGLTTAASLWTVACLGLAVGMGYYLLAFIGFIIIQATLSLLNKVIVIPSIKNLEIKFVHREETKEFIKDYFKDHGVDGRATNVSVDFLDNRRIYTNIYTIEIPKHYDIDQMIEELAIHDNVRRIRLIDM